MEKAVNFFVEYFHSAISWSNPSDSISRIKKASPALTTSSFMKSELRNYKQVSLSHTKSIKEHGFMKKFSTIVESMPYVSTGYRPEKISVGLIEEAI